MEHCGYPDPNITIITSKLGIVLLPFFADQAAYVVHRLLPGTNKAIRSEFMCAVGLFPPKLYDFIQSQCV